MHLARELADGQLLAQIVDEIKRDLFDEYSNNMREYLRGADMTPLIEVLAMEHEALQKVVERIQRKASEGVNNE